MKLFTRLLGASGQPAPQSTPLAQVAITAHSTSTIGQGNLQARGSGSGSRQSQKATKIRDRRPKKGKRKGTVKLEENRDEVEQHRDDEEVDQLASDSDPEVIVIEDDD